MKLITINIHSHYNKMTQEQLNNALEELSKLIIQENVDVIALQECSQTHNCDDLHVKKDVKPFDSFCPIETDCVKVKNDNFAYLLAKNLSDQGATYYWTWTGAKLGYDIYDEGLAILSLAPIQDREAFYYSNQEDYHNWKSRKTVGICIEEAGKKMWFYSVHMGWWNDEDEPFASQIDRLQSRISDKKDEVFLLGDFNSQADIRGEGYDYVRNLGWQDTFCLARQRDDGITVPGTIDGWTEVKKGMRIDYIFSKNPLNVLSSRVVFQGKTEAVISDHYGVLIEIL